MLHTAYTHWLVRWHGLALLQGFSIELDSLSIGFYACGITTLMKSHPRSMKHLKTYLFGKSGSELKDMQYGHFTKNKITMRRFDTIRLCKQHHHLSAQACAAQPVWSDVSDRWPTLELPQSSDGEVTTGHYGPAGEELGTRCLFMRLVTHVEHTSCLSSDM